MSSELDTSEFWDEYVEDSRRNLELFQSAMLEFDLNRTDENFDVVFGILHSIKGVAGTIGVDVVIRSSHQTETSLKDFWEKEDRLNADLPEDVKFLEVILEAVIEERFDELLQDPTVAKYFNSIGASSEEFKTFPSVKNDPIDLGATNEQVTPIDSAIAASAPSPAPDPSAPTSAPPTSMIDSIAKEPMVQLVYVSKKSEGVKLFDIVNFSQQAQDRNKTMGITGMLIYYGDHFLQVLEGPVNRVNKLYSVIAHDERHHDVKLVNVSTIYTRRFEGWSLNNISTLSYQKFRDVLVTFGLVSSYDAFPLQYEIINIIIEKLRSSPEGILE